MCIDFSPPDNRKFGQLWVRIRTSYSPDIPKCCVRSSQTTGQVWVRTLPQAIFCIFKWLHGVCQEVWRPKIAYWNIFSLAARTHNFC